MHLDATEFLLGKGANLTDTDGEGLTPLMVACRAGRDQTAQVILHHLALSSADPNSDYVEKKFGRGGVNRPGKDSWGPLHLAVVAEKGLQVRVE